MKFVLDSHVKIERLSLRRSGSLAFRAKSDTHSPLAPDYKICDFQFPKEVLEKKISHQNEDFTRNENRSELIPERLVREQMFVSVSCEHYAKKYMEME